MSKTQGGNKPGPKTLAELFAQHPIKTAPGLCAGPILIGHRGASLDQPENTIPSFARALELGADMLELDVRLSADGHVIVIHDAKVDRTTNGKGLVKNFTLGQLKAFKTKAPIDLPRYTPPSHVPPEAPLTETKISSLEEIFLAFPDTVIAVEIKDDSWSLCLKVVELIKRYNRIDRTSLVLISLKARLAKALRKLEPALVSGHTLAEIVRFVALSKLRSTRLFDAQGSIFEVPLKRGKISIVTKAFVRAAHKKGVRVFVWTINDAAAIAKLYKMGVDGIFTDDLAIAKTVIEHLQLLGK